MLLLKTQRDKCTYKTQNKTSTERNLTCLFFFLYIYIFSFFQLFYLHISFFTYGTFAVYNILISFLFFSKFFCEIGSIPIPSYAFNVEELNGKRHETFGFIFYFCYFFKLKKKLFGQIIFVSVFVFCAFCVFCLNVFVFVFF